MSGLLKFGSDLLLKLLRRALADMGLLLGDLLYLGDVLAELVAAFFSSLTTLLLSLSNFMLDFLAKEQIRLINALLAVHGSLAAFLLDTRRDWPTSVHEDDLTLLCSALKFVGDVGLADLR